MLDMKTNSHGIQLVPVRETFSQGGLPLAVNLKLTPTHLKKNVFMVKLRTNSHGIQLVP
jgi:hypothetical protein